MQKCIQVVCPTTHRTTSGTPSCNSAFGSFKNCPSYFAVHLGQFSTRCHLSRLGADDRPPFKCYFLTIFSEGIFTALVRLRCSRRQLKGPVPADGYPNSGLWGVTAPKVPQRATWGTHELSQIPQVLCLYLYFSLKIWQYLFLVAMQRRTI